MRRSESATTDGIVGTDSQKASPFLLLSGGSSMFNCHLPSSIIGTEKKREKKGLKRGMRVQGEAEEGTAGKRKPKEKKRNGGKSKEEKKKRKLPEERSRQGEGRFERTIAPLTFPSPNSEESAIEGLNALNDFFNGSTRCSPPIISPTTPIVARGTNREFFPSVLGATVGGGICCFGMNFLKPNIVMMGGMGCFEAPRG